MVNLYQIVQAESTTEIIPNKIPIDLNQDLSRFFYLFNSLFFLMYANTTNIAKMMITMMCTGNYLFNSLMVFLASPLLRKYPIIFDITDDTDLSSSSAISFRKSSLSLVVLNDKKESFFIVKIYNKVWHIMTILIVWQLLTFYNLWHH